MLVHSWRAVLRRAWSVRLMALALIFIILEPVINFVAGTSVCACRCRMRVSWR
ncbi:UNVERIFIED_ORG: hypothetical protein GGD59_006123 [Rhizobium esperanzae]